jgi:hypothetical protein
MALYHVSKQQLASGQILKPGNFGRSARQFRRGGPAPTPAIWVNIGWESCLELARQKFAPEGTPSRLDCVFACKTLADATKFRDRFQPGATIYEVEDDVQSLSHN